MMMLDQWLQNFECTWSTVCDALEAIGNKRLAAEIETKYGKGNSEIMKYHLNILLVIFSESLHNPFNLKCTKLFLSYIMFVG